MPRRASLKQMKDVMQVRDVQRLAAEMQVVRINAELRQLDAQRDESVNKIQMDHDRWVEVISGPSFGLDFADGWSRSILQGEAELGRIDVQIGQTEDERTRRSEAWQASQARADAAEAMAGRAHRRERRLAEEAELAEATDRFLQRGARP